MILGPFEIRSIFRVFEGRERWFFLKNVGLNFYMRDHEAQLSNLVKFQLNSLLKSHFP